MLASGFPGDTVVKNLLTNARNAGSIPVLGRSRGIGNGKDYCSSLAWKMPWTEEPGGLQSLGVVKSWI